jgi:outer membrane protein assembly factor BamB
MNAVVWLAVIQVAVAQVLPAAQWGMLGQNSQHSSQSPYNVTPGPLRVRWAVQGCDYLFPAVGPDGTVYCTWYTTLYAMEPRRGEAKWTNYLSNRAISSPAVGVNGTVYLPSRDGNMYAFNGATGVRIWMFQTGGLSAQGAAPTIGPDGTVYFSGGGNVYALDGGSGAQKWVVPLIAGVTSPAVSTDGKVFINGGASIYALDAQTGSSWWSYNIGNSATVAMSSPVVGSGGNVYVGTGASLLALNGETGRRLWSYNGGSNCSFQSTAAIASNGLLYASCATTSGNETSVLNAFNALTGALQWTFAPTLYIAAPPAIGADGTLYVGARGGLVSGDSYVYALDGLNGTTPIWTFTVGFATAADFSPVIGRDGVLYVCAHYLYALVGIPPSSSPAPTPSPLPAQSQPTPGLDTDATIAIGVLVPVILIGMAAACWRKGKRSPAAATADSNISSDHNMQPLLQAEAAVGGQDPALECDAGVQPLIAAVEDQVSTSSYAALDMPIKDETHTHMPVYVSDVPDVPVSDVHVSDVSDVSVPVATVTSALV